ncbi:murein biosynthesis integral membrane protein MurJ [Calorimonas adulescens]|uniref:Probable lipid II flippase MurJ n=1 Tax=Calorimonas adulescens TaxID=2606906 RepID=A0A5D8Q8S8_9THEO|nr:murein biosynthesis integral membrane protein MurJ [Calorimonas adulescens]TZE80921.1 murein biosynthesis integral membrane protein MurJ [Calorimonas adulescens]
MASNVRRAAKAATLIMAANIISKFLGFLREMVIAREFGAGLGSDAYFMAQSIPMLFFTSIGSALATTFIPLYTEYKSKNGREDADRFANQIMNLVLIVSVVLTVAGVLFSPLLVRIIAPGFTGEKLSLTVGLSRTLFPLIIFVGLANVATGILQSNESFTAPALVGIPYNIIIIALTIILADRIGIYGLAIASVLATVSQYYIQVPSMRRLGYHHRYSMDFSHPGIKRLGLMIVPVLMGVAVNQLNTFVDRMLASGLPEGSVSALNYANRLNGFVLGTFVTSVATVVYPSLSNLGAKEEMESFKDSVATSLNMIFLIVLPVTAGTILLRTEAVRLLFERGAFDARATGMTSVALLFYSIGMAGAAAREILSRAFYSLKDTRTPMYNGMYAVALNIILNIVLVRFMGLAGLALATSISVIFTSFTLGWRLRNKIGGINGRLILKEGIKIAISTAVMAVAVYFFKNFIYSYIPGVSLTAQIINLALTVFVGAIVYGICTIIFKVREVTRLFSFLYRRLHINNV